MLAREVVDELTEVSRFGILDWKDHRGGPGFFGPARYISMSVADKPVTCDRLDLIRVANGSFLATQGEQTGFSGLLRLHDLLLPSGFSPKDILIAGAISHKSVDNFYKWIRHLGWTNPNVTLVDRSFEPIDMINLLKSRGHRSYPNLCTIQSDLSELNTHQRFDLVFADIILPYNVEPFNFPALRRQSPYHSYEQTLAWINSHLTPRGILMERTICFPGELTKATNHRDDNSVEQRVADVLSSTSRASLIDIDWLKEEVEVIFQKSYPPTLCGLTNTSPVFTPVRPVVGPESIKIVDRLHRRHFNDFKRVEVLDPHSGCRYISYGCSH